MKAFTIDAENNITVHASRKAARDAGVPAFATEEQFADLIGPDNKRLVEIWNSLPGLKAVTKFANRKVATGRIWEAIQRLGDRAATEPTPEEPTDTTSAGTTPEVVTPFDPIEEEPAPATGEPAEPLATVSAQAPDVAPKIGKASKKATPVAKPAKALKKAKGEGVREGSKTAQVVSMLQRKSGATIDEIMEKMAWQKHTVRGFIAGAMKKAGYTVESFKSPKGERTYRINQ